mmetsp:Transcript_18/g.36  ORF Transcript_18/g.36 Transcript_18/m.36 type:complete len:93 (+) Transcript_18:19-297(+)
MRRALRTARPAQNSRRAVIVSIAIARRTVRDGHLDGHLPSISKLRRNTRQSSRRRSTTSYLWMNQTSVLFASNLLYTECTGAPEEKEPSNSL